MIVDHKPSCRQGCTCGASEAGGVPVSAEERLAALPRWAMVGDLNDRHLDVVPDGGLLLRSDVLAVAAELDGVSVPTEPGTVCDQCGHTHFVPATAADALCECHVGHGVGVPTDEVVVLDELLVHARRPLGDRLGRTTDARDFGDDAFRAAWTALHEVLIRATLREADPEGLAEGVAAAADEPPVIAELEGAVGAAVSALAPNSTIGVSAERVDA